MLLLYDPQVRSCCFKSDVYPQPEIDAFRQLRHLRCSRPLHPLPAMLVENIRSGQLPSRMGSLQPLDCPVVHGGWTLKRCFLTTPKVLSRVESLSTPRRENASNVVSRVADSISSHQKLTASPSVAACLNHLHTTLAHSPAGSLQQMCAMHTWQRHDEGTGSAAT